MFSKLLPPCNGLTPFHLNGHWDLWDNTASSSARPWCPRLPNKTISACPSPSPHNTRRPPNLHKLGCGHILNRLLPIQHQPQQRTQQPFHMRTRARIHHSPLNILRPQILQLARHRLTKPCSKGNNLLFTPKIISRRVYSLSGASQARLFALQTYCYGRVIC